MKKLSVLMICWAACVAQNLNAQDKKNDDDLLAYVPALAQKFSIFRPAKILDRPVIADFKRSLGPLFDKMFDRTLNRYLKFSLADPTELDAIVHAQWGEKSEQQGAEYSQSYSLMLMRTTEPNSERFDMATHAVKSETEFDGKTIFEMKTPLDGIYRFACILDDQTIAWSYHDLAIRKAIEAGKAGARKSEFYKKWREYADQDFSFLFSVTEDELQFAPEGIKALKNVKFAVGGGDLGKKSALKATAFCHDARQAEAIVGLAKKQIEEAVSELDNRMKSRPADLEMMKLGKQILNSIKIERRRNQVNVVGSLKLDFKAIAQPLQEVYTAQKRTEAANNLRQQCLGCLNFESAYGHLPKSVMIHEKTGKKYSWRIAILPFIERNDIYQKYDFSQEWDSPHNLEVTSEMPDFFRADSDDKETTNTSFFLLTGPGGAYGKEENLTLADFRDGTSNTIMAIEAQRDVHWAKPEDIEIHPDQPLPDFGGYHDGGFNVVRVDGSVAFIPENVAEEYLRQMFTPSGGEIPLRTIPLKDDE